jgi:hypothetical protein
MDNDARDATLAAIGTLTAYLNRTADHDRGHRDFMAEIVKEGGADALIRMIHGQLNLGVMLAAGAAARENKTPEQLLQGLALALEQGRD